MNERELIKQIIVQLDKIEFSEEFTIDEGYSIAAAIGFLEEIKP